jgi:hypothetical protein
MIFESVWRDPNLHINKGRQWNAFSDQLSADDMNFIVSNLNYVKERLTSGQGTLVSVNGKPVLSFDATDLVFKTTMDLVNYYSKEEINEMIGGRSSLSIEVVTELPTENASSSTIYLTPVGDGNNTYNEWLYVNNKWELIGSTQVDLTNYYTKDEIVSLLAGFAKIADIPVALSQLNNDVGFTGDAAANNIANNTTVISPTSSAAALLMGLLASAGTTTHGTVLGNGASATGSNSTVIGNLASAGNYSISAGKDAVGGDYGVSIGANTNGYGGVAAGYRAKINYLNAVAVGRDAVADGVRAIQIGTGTNSTAYSVQFHGDNVYNTSTHTLTVQNAQVGGSDVLTKANFTLDGTTLTITI